MKKEINKIAFIVPEFPSVSQTWLLSQITGLIDRGFEVDIYSFKQGESDNVSDEYVAYNLSAKTTYLYFPQNKLTRLVKGIGLLFYVLLQRPKIIPKLFDISKYGDDARSLKLLYKLVPFVGKENTYDVIHCHFGTVANKFIPVKEILGLEQPHLCTFYGYDISHTPDEKGSDVYDDVVKHFDKFLVMSENMKRRAAEVGIPVERTLVHPISINTDDYPFHEREFADGETIKLMSVGRFVEKKGYDDLIRALAIVKKEVSAPFTFDLVGDGVLRLELEALANSESIRDVLTFKGYMKPEDIQKLYEKTHLYLQPSKTAADGDME